MLLTAVRWYGKKKGTPGFFTWRPNLLRRIPDVLPCLGKIKSSRYGQLLPRDKFKLARLKLHLFAVAKKADDTEHGHGRPGATPHRYGAEDDACFPLVLPYQHTDFISLSHNLRLFIQIQVSLYLMVGLVKGFKR